MENRYYTSFWNYVKTGEIENESAADDWKKMGINLPMSWEYIDGVSDKQCFLGMLDALEKRGMKTILCDSRTHWKALTEKGEKAYEEGVRRAVADFGNHPAAFGFHIGDEPNKTQMPDMIRAYKIVKKAAPHLSPFVNFLPYWEDYADEDSFNAHVEYMDKVAKEAELEMICYDYYGQMATNDSARLIDLYFKNLNAFRLVAERNRIPPVDDAFIHRALQFENHYRGRRDVADRHRGGARVHGDILVLRVFQKSRERFVPQLSHRQLRRGKGIRGRVLLSFPPEPHLFETLRRPSRRVPPFRRAPLQRELRFYETF